MRISDWSSYVFSSDLLGTSALPNIQLFANVSRSAEVPSYDAGIFSSPTADMKAQRATTYEIGTRGSSGGIGWDISLYRSEIRNELQCLTLFPWNHAPPIMPIAPTLRASRSAWLPPFRSPLWATLSRSPHPPP